MRTITTTCGNLGEILYTNAELRLFTKNKEKRLFQCALKIVNGVVECTLAASFVESERRTLMEVREVLRGAGYKKVKFQRQLDGEFVEIQL